MAGIHDDVFLMIEEQRQLVLSFGPQWLQESSLEDVLKRLDTHQEKALNASRRLRLVKDRPGAG